MYLFHVVWRIRKKGEEGHSVCPRLYEEEKQKCKKTKKKNRSKTGKESRTEPVFELK
jgi:hypothetical protein